MKKLFILGFVTLFVTSTVGASQVWAQTVVDHQKQVINKRPNHVEVCYQQQQSGDKTGDTLKGAIIGGVIGNNVGDIKNGGALGAVLGGMFGHNNSKATGGYRTVCKHEVRYTEEVTTVYSHSTVTFRHEGRTYSLKFHK